MIDIIKKNNDYTSRLIELEELIRVKYAGEIEIGETYFDKVENFMNFTLSPFMYFSSLYISKDSYLYIKEAAKIVETFSGVISYKEAFEMLRMFMENFVDNLLDYIGYDEDAREIIKKAVQDNNFDVFKSNCSKDKEKGALLKKYVSILYRTGLGLDGAKFLDSLENGVPTEDEDAAETVNSNNKIKYDFLIYYNYILDLSLELIKNLVDDYGFYEEKIKAIKLQVETNMPQNSSDEEIAKWLYEDFFLFSSLYMEILYYIVKANGTIKEFTIIRKILMNPTFSYFNNKLVEYYDSSFKLDVLDFNEEIFSCPPEGSKDEFFYNLHPAIIEGGTDRFSQLFNIYSFPNGSNYVELQTFVYRLTGRMRPSIPVLPQIEIGPDDADFFVYLINKLVVVGNEEQDVYSKIKKFFKGAKFPEKEEDIEYNIPPIILQELASIYPSVFSEGVPRPEIKESVDSMIPAVQSREYFFIPPDLFKNIEYDYVFSDGRRLKQQYESMDNVTKRLNKLFKILYEKGYIDDSYETQNCMLMALTGKSIIKNYTFKKIQLNSEKADVVINRVVGLLCEHPHYKSLGDLFIPHNKNYKWRSYGTRKYSELDDINKLFPPVV